MTRRRALDSHDLKSHLEAVQKIGTVLSYPPGLAHEIRRGWPEIQFLLRGVHRFFSSYAINKDCASEESEGLVCLSRIFSELVSAWLQSPAPPSRFEIERFTALADELVHHFERQISHEEELAAHYELTARKRA